MQPKLQPPAHPFTHTPSLCTFHYPYLTNGSLSPTTLYKRKTQAITYPAAIVCRIYLNASSPPLHVRLFHSRISEYIGLNSDRSQPPAPPQPTLVLSVSQAAAARNCRAQTRHGGQQCGRGWGWGGVHTLYQSPLRRSVRARRWVWFNAATMDSAASTAHHTHAHDG